MTGAVADDIGGLSRDLVKCQEPIRQPAASIWFCETLTFAVLFKYIWTASFTIRQVLPKNLCIGVNEQNKLCEVHELSQLLAK